MSDQLNQQPHQVADDEIDLRELFSAIWQGKWFIIITTAIFATASVFYALSLPNIYKSEALLAPANVEAGSRISGQLSGLAALAGVNMGNGQGDKTALAIEVLKSRDFIGRFIEKYDLFVPVMSATGWNSGSDTLIINQDLFNTETNQWVRKANPPFQPKPSLQEVYAIFMRSLSVSQDKTTGMVRLSIEHVSPSLAKQWVDKLILEINENMRQRELSEAQRSIAYLNEQISQTNLADARSMLFSLIEEQTKTLMLANVRNEYVFKTIDPAVVAELKAKPARAVICIIGVLLGGMLSVLVVFVRYFSKKESGYK